MTYYDPSVAPPLSQDYYSTEQIPTTPSDFNPGGLGSGSFPNANTIGPPGLYGVNPPVMPPFPTAPVNFNLGGGGLTNPGGSPIPYFNVPYGVTMWQDN